MNFLKKLLGGIGKPKRDIHLGRNDECWCGSGKKYKKCCMAKDEPLRAREREKASPRSGGGMSMM